MKVWPVLGIVLLQLFLFFAHWFLFHSIVSFFPLSETGRQVLAALVFLCAISFVIAALLSFRFSNLAVEVIYTAASIWLGLFNFLFWACCLSWLSVGLLHLAHADTAAHRTTAASILFALAFAITIGGMINARILRERRVTVTLPGLPPSWRNRTGLLVSDVHLGNINQARFARRVAAIVHRLRPDIVFLPGDLYDGSQADPHRIAAPLFDIKPPLGVYFSGGNHEEFGDVRACEAAIRAGGFRILHNEHVLIDGVRIIGINYVESTQPLRVRAFLESLQLDPAQPSILLNHVPNRLPIVERAGVSLQLSGHTHSGQFTPFTWLTRRVFGKFTYGLQRYGNLQVLTSCGVGTWGPPMRIGTAPEVVLITFA